MEKFRSAPSRVGAWVVRSRPWATVAATLSLKHDGAVKGQNEHGQGLAEYALILGLIAIVAIASLVFLGDTITSLFWAPISDDFGKILSEIL